MIPSQYFGAPATNVTLPPDTVHRIAETVRRLEKTSPFAGVNFAESSEAQSLLSGDWKLLYSDASEITRLINLPLGFKLGTVFQPIDTVSGRFENQARVRHSLWLASGSTRVVARFSLADLGETNRVGVENCGNRVNVKFERVIFSLRRLLVLPFFDRVKKVAVPNGPSEQAGVVPCIDITFLDSSLRVSRGGDGSLFVLSRPEGEAPLPMLPASAGEMAVTTKKTFNAATDVLPAGKPLE